MTQEQHNPLSPAEQNASSLEQELIWFENILQARFNPAGEHFGDIEEVYKISPPEHQSSDSMYVRFLRHYKPTLMERLLTILCLLPHIRPELLDIFFMKNSTYARGFTEFGGTVGQMHGGFLPTGETAAFLLCGQDLALRFHLKELLSKRHFFSKHNILRLDVENDDEPELSGRLQMSPEYIEYFTSGKLYVPPFNAKFPAKPIYTSLGWNDLVLKPELASDIEEIKGWINFGHILMNDWGLDKVIRPGFRSLFYGPPGTGKTLTATLLGKSSGREVYRIDLSKVISKYIGETEKNLANVFDMAENKDWILFFDEADSLFSKRTETRNSNDRSANQQVAYLLQRIEDYSGVAILASNLRANLDEAFTRRFDSIVYFGMPEKNQRLALWKNYFEPKNPYFELDEAVNLEEMADKYELAGGNIINVLRFCCIHAINRNERKIHLRDIQLGIRKEFLKMGKSFI
ncbi:MAG: ATP-binding protein [Bacteroidia bacterium]|nr:ATP-binding protein [Bacteroidia bacterium]